MKKLERIRNRSKSVSEAKRSVDQLHAETMRTFKQEKIDFSKDQAKLEELERKYKNDRLVSNVYELSENIRELRTKLETIKERELDYVCRYSEFLLESQGIEDYNDKLDIYYQLVDRSECNDRGESDAVCENCYTLFSENGTYCESRDIWICSGCGYIYRKSLTDDLQGETPMEEETEEWSDSINLSTPFKYTRLNNFRMHLQRLQGVEAKQIPDVVTEAVRKELNARRINDPRKIDNTLIKKILKHTGNNKYYNNINSIIQKITGRKPPQLSTQFIEELEIMFNDVETNFDKYKPLFTTNRQHFFSYNFIFNKLLHIIAHKNQSSAEEIHRIIPLFPLLKSREKLIEQDKVWKKVCEDRGWPFFASV